MTPVGIKSIHPTPKFATPTIYYQASSAQHLPRCQLNYSSSPINIIVIRAVMNPLRRRGFSLPTARIPHQRQAAPLFCTTQKPVTSGFIRIVFTCTPATSNSAAGWHISPPSPGHPTANLFMRSFPGEGIAAPGFQISPNFLFSISRPESPRFIMSALHSINYPRIYPGWRSSNLTLLTHRW